MAKRILITGLLGAVLGFYSITAYKTLHSLQIFFVSNTMGKIYAYTYLITSLLSVIMILSFISSVVKAVKKRKNPQPEQTPVKGTAVQAEIAENQGVQHADEHATEIDIPDDEPELDPAQPADDNVTEID